MQIRARSQELSTVIDVIETLEIRDSLINNTSNSTNSLNDGAAGLVWISAGDCRVEDS